MKKRQVINAFGTDSYSQFLIDKAANLTKQRTRSAYMHSVIMLNVEQILKHYGYTDQMLKEEYERLQEEG